MAILFRRLLTVPLYFALWGVVIAGLPLLLLLAAVVDLARGGGSAAVRCILFFALYLTCESLGIVASFVLWVTLGIRGGRRNERYQHANFVLQCWWAAALLRGVQTIFSLRIELDGQEVTAQGPFFLFLRHASVGDTVLAANFVAGRYGIRLRYVLKRELLWDPCLDIVGNRLPNCFVRRGSGDSAREVAAVRRLARDLGPRDGVLIYPEGTRFTPEKRARILRRLGETHTPDTVARASALHHVLPPRLGGVLGLLEERDDVDVVFCAHSGFDGVTSFADLINGELIGRTVRVCFWRVPCSAIPSVPNETADWVFAEWARVDEWVGRNKESGGGQRR